jgi:hypothetical protein
LRDRRGIPESIAAVDVAPEILRQAVSAGDGGDRPAEGVVASPGAKVNV